MNSDIQLLVINPGSTTTKVAYFNHDVSKAVKTITHSVEELENSTVLQQQQLRHEAILAFLREYNIKLSQLHAIVARGGLIQPIPSGTYEVNDELLNDAREGPHGWHASNFGALLAYELAKQVDIPAFIVDPVVVDELEPVSRVSGLKGIERKSIFHALNQKAVAKKIAKSWNRPYESLHVIVAHLGGGITVGAHKLGKVIDVNNGLYGEGPFSPERTGTLPVGDLVDLCYNYNKDQVLKLLAGAGGLVSYVETNNGLEIENRIQAGDEEAQFYLEAMGYQVAKEIGAASVSLAGHVDAIIITGGLAHSERLVDTITERVKWISKVVVSPGEDEMMALAEGASRVLLKEEKAKHYPSGTPL
ncbi:butyrate kinase [Alkalihalobacillus sp. LMS39]|uniref:butyrate kinase n=1 Tax=Alkalihalobacillus sp. LMS39 TaxID=2924032 RepID=UPI001FB4A4A1|nr:butyrate kinase [Alkalihalobacillus sp. LMS39]UOE95952.1 butyrate kinase [Alkalihalobacillus sp. LMS39]